MLKRFLDDARGNYMLITAVAMVPIMGGLALAVDYSEMSRQRQATMNALDAANIATAWYITDGGGEEGAVDYAKDFFQANLGPVSPDKATLRVTLPADNAGGGTLLMTADLRYEPYFYPAFKALLSGFAGDHTTEIDFSATSEVRLKNTLEVALVLDNSGSMDYNGSGSGKKRIELLRDAAKELVETLAAQADLMKQVVKPVQFGLVPFAASVNVGPQYANASWMDRDGISPIHHENFDWSTMSSGSKRVEKIGGVWYKKGAGWGDAENEKVTRFTLYDEMKYVSSYECTGTVYQGHCYYGDWVPDGYGAFTSWQGCVEMRPSPYGVNDEAVSSATPATLFVPMFGPDEIDTRDGNNRPANNNWWPDRTSGTAAARQRYMPKYFQASENGAMGGNQGPNVSCTTKPITPLTDVTVQTGLDAVKAAIDAMEPLGATNVPEGLAWGWRVLSHRAPFTEGRPDTDKGNDKVVIVLTDGANTYYTPDSVQANSYSGGDWWKGGNDQAGNKSIYSSFGYAGKGYNGTTTSRIFKDTDTTVSYSNGTYTAAMNDHLDAACANAKDEEVILITVALDLSTSNATEKEQINRLKECASFSRHRTDADGNPVKLFWNTTGADLSKTFSEIADELSNLRIVG